MESRDTSSGHCSGSGLESTNGQKWFFHACQASLNESSWEETSRCETRRWIINLHLINGVGVGLRLRPPCTGLGVRVSAAGCVELGRQRSSTSPYYYCHDKGLDPRVPKSRIAILFADFPRCGGGGDRRWRVRERSGFIFRYVPAAFLLSCRGASLSRPSSPLLSSPRSPPSSSSQHLKQQEYRVDFQFHFQINKWTPVEEPPTVACLKSTAVKTVKRLI